MVGRVASFVIVIAVATAGFAADPPEEPRDLGLTEHAFTRLAQIDVTVSGVKGTIEALTAADFEVKLNDKLVRNVLVDDLCVAPRVQPAAASLEASAPAAALRRAEPPKTMTATYLLYFDMSHLTQSGRQGAIDAAREMLPKLLAGSNRATIVANAASLKTIVPLTTDRAKLDAALAGMTGDLSTFDPYAALEQQRMGEIVKVLADPMEGSTGALRLAWRYASEERLRQEGDLRRLSMVLGRFADLDPPKVVLYFADTMRQNAGEHYLSFFNAGNLLGGKGANEKPVADADAIGFDAATGALPLDRVINDADALGIRFYTIEGQGMTGEASPIEARTSASTNGNQAPPVVNAQHLRDAQNTMVSMAAETGGRAFLNGVSPGRMTAQILRDLSCVYLLSFDPTGFAQDNPLAVNVIVKRANVKTAVRGRLVIQSDSARVTGRVLSAFVSPAAGVAGSNANVHVGVIPISYETGKFKARVQIALGGSAVPTTTWDIGASVVSQGVVWQEGSGRIEVMLPNTPVVFEKDMEFAPGEYDLVAVARETQTDTVLSTEVHGTWPKVDAELASIGPIAVSQQRSGGFLRNGDKQTQGPVVVAADEPLQADAPTAVMALVCRAKDQKRSLQVVRTLIGETETPVGTSVLDATAQRCAQVVDLIPPKLLGPGRYRFVVTVSSNGQELARGERTFLVPEQPATAAKSAL